MERIIDYLDSNGWKILRKEEGMVFAERILTGKHSFFLKKNSILNDEIEISRVWTKKGFHPFIYFEKNGKLVFYDFLFDEFVKNP